MLGATVLTALPELLRFTSQYRLIVYGLIIVLVVLVRPEGLLTRRPTGQARRLFGRTLVPERPVGPVAERPAERPLPLALAQRAAPR